jgi:hypothetical protein
MNLIFTYISFNLSSSSNSQGVLPFVVPLLPKLCNNVFNSHPWFLTAVGLDFNFNWRSMSRHILSRRISMFLAILIRCLVHLKFLISFWSCTRCPQVTNGCHSKCFYPVLLRSCVSCTYNIGISNTAPNSNLTGNRT